MTLLPTSFIALRRPKQAVGTFVDSVPTYRSDHIPSLEICEYQTSETSLDEIIEDDNILSIAPQMSICIPSSPLNFFMQKSVPADKEWALRIIGALDSQYDGNGTSVAILDTGIDETHPAFSGLKLTQRDFTGSGNGDRNGHGTHVAGTVFGRTIDSIRIGVAPAIEHAIIAKVLDDRGRGSTKALLEALDWVYKQGAELCNLSLNLDLMGYIESMKRQGYSPEAAVALGALAFHQNLELFRTYASFIKERGTNHAPMLLIASAGNESNRPNYAIPSTAPGGSEGFISCGSISKLGTPSLFSNDNIELCAPGEDILSSAPGGNYTRMSGTSMAAPHVTGIAALWIQKLKADKLFSGAAVYSKLTGCASTKELSMPLPHTSIGHGLVRAP